MNFMKKYNQWLDSDMVDESTKRELKNIKNDKKELEDRFYKNLSFGTGGLRGIIGAGSNRMNIYTVRKATQGLANYLNKTKDKNQKSVAIAYDSRNFSDVFALEAANKILEENKIKIYLCKVLKPTPVLSFAVRELICDFGVVITASHNPAKYNGYKVYGNDGGQITIKIAHNIISEIDKINIFKDVFIISKDKAINEGLIEYIENDIDEKYFSKIFALALKYRHDYNNTEFKIIYTPIHGSGLKPVTRALKRMGYKHVFLVRSQAEPNGNFPTVNQPNPEEKDVFSLGILLAKEKNADILIATDPDADRLGLVVKSSNGDYKMLSGNQIGVLLTYYIFSSMDEITSKDVLVKTIVTSELGAKIAQSYGASVVNTLTGFKFIGEKIKEFKQDNSFNFIFGYEESYGYLAGTFVRDKDAIIASVLIVEMASYYKSKGMNLIDVLDSIHNIFGYYSEKLETYYFDGIEGTKKISNLIKKFRNLDEIISVFENIKVIEDYKYGKRTFVRKDLIEKIELPQSNVIKVIFNNKSWFSVFPTVNEPK